jgi:2-amino-4-hydroxy-6-hydroxymethyldihydropteridine diphosphokinase
MKKTASVYIALGTNIGDREANLQTAKVLLSRKATITQESSVYTTPPWGYKDQPDFLNQVIEVSSRLEPLPLLRFLKDIEKKMGREKLILNGPRLIDLDILFYGDRVVNSEHLQVPHPRMEGRAFVLVPLNEIAPDLIHPVLGISVREMLTGTDTSGVIRQ